MSEIHETTTYVPPTNDDWWIARLLAVKAAWAADQERLRVAEARLVEVEQALRSSESVRNAGLELALRVRLHRSPDTPGVGCAELLPSEYETVAGIVLDVVARAVLDKGEPDG